MRIVLDPDDLDAVALRLGVLINERITEMANVTQQQLDAWAARIQTAVDGIRADIAALKAANPDVDTSALEARVASLEGLDTENPEVPPAPTP